MRLERNTGRRAAIAVLVIAFGVLSLSLIERPESPVAPDSNPANSMGSARLVSVQELPSYADTCLEAPNDGASAIAALQEQASGSGFSLYAVLNQTVHAAQNGGATSEVTRMPVRTIKDSYPIYSSIAVDPERDEVVLQDTNHFSIKVFNRLENTPQNIEAATPKRVILGSKTLNEYNNGLSIDKNGDIYSVAMDTADSVFVFDAEANGDVAPKRRLKTPHRNFQSALDEEKGEIFVTIQYPPKVMVYRMNANGTDAPLRIIEGPKTEIFDAHGIAIDVKRKLMFVGSWGNDSTYTVAGTGTWHPPSITVYPLDAKGDVAPIRKIQGDRTQLNWMGGFSIEPVSGDLYVGNDVNSSILRFKGTDNGNVAPIQVIKGDKTGLNHPASVSVDAKNKEVWVSNMGNSTASAFSLTANGNVAPIRTIRSAPAGRVSLKFGKPQAVAYDSKREEYLVPN